METRTNYFVVVVVAVVAVVGVSLSMVGIALNFDFVVQYRARIWDGFCLTVFISLFSLCWEFDYRFR